ncbi:4-hydroxy-tetrahydrodipicolinate synthase [Gilliamella apis]|uniref:4-hydroxy-tetrahydrodipicolinate synthase n=1 Tax=Gilliamella apis TaxID=1970738 RepID=UPI000A33CDB0|nr:4-hydroxy-tetrahydrodipicolinate synthase [Gilliamella apis]OTQ61574.1 4-hydroxy-tetrahydrodipicolinate synthase [Gilliamella apis]OTQ63931.1 4-hydroxy-tetrahydrodipicolinate synthase [Gilliamella apis]OTQ66399.1 4-hydroxy-tetrahydrodipicolinate synthase [Gilliamella apis]OTQ66908.1 4-hydroxy-tetrahydrodipicolinate synthase [Gilliamella apis]
MLNGIITAMVTPFESSGNIDIKATEILIEKLIANGVQGIFVLGTNGEFHVIENDMKIKFAKKVVEIVANRVPVYAGAGGNSTDEVIKLGKQMIAVGVDALSVITPYFVSLKENELYNHYQMIAENLAIPIVLYNIPKNTGINLSFELVSKLSKISNIIGIKDSSGDINNIAGYIDNTSRNEFSVLSGSDSLILKALKIGATGAISATSNLLTTNNVEIYKQFIAGNLDKAEQWQQSLEEFRRILKYASIPSVLKQSLSLSGIEVGVPRLPVLPVTNPNDNQDIVNTIKNYYHL